MKILKSIILQRRMYLGRMNKKQVFILESWKSGEVLNKKSIK